MHEQRAVKWLVGIVPLVAVVLTLIVIAIPGARLHIDSPTAGPIALTAAALAELSVAFFMAHRFGRTASLMDFGLAVGLGVMGVADLIVSLWRATLDPDLVSPVIVVPYHAVGAAILVLAAWAPNRPLLRRPRVRLVVGTVLQIPIGLALLQHVGMVPGRTSGGQSLGIVALRLAVVALLAIAAAGLIRRRDRRADPLLRWMIAALVIAGLTQLHRAAIPAPPTASLTWAHVLQLAVAAAFLTGCVGEVRLYRRRLEEAAIAEERRRLARDLHDGLVQDLAFIASQSKYLATRLDEDRLGMIASAAQRALDDSRFVVGALGRASGQPLRASIALQAHEFARRWGLNIRVAVADEMDLAPDKEQAILRIVGEALSNAARHAEATTVDIEVGNRDGHSWVAVSDDGRGFDAVAAQADERGFGLRSMRERAELVGGDLRLDSEPGSGTRVEIALS